MPTFAIISEGVTDQVILEHIIELIVDEKFEHEVFFNQVQPVRDVTDSHTAPHGGWGLVLEACSVRAPAALLANDYLVVQIDTDCADEVGFEVPLTEGGSDRHIADIITDTKALLRSKIGDELYEAEKNRIVFAVCVHSIESWILLVVYGDSSVKSGESRLKKFIAKNNHEAFSKTERRYDKFCSSLRRRTLDTKRRLNASLDDFICQVETL